MHIVDIVTGADTKRIRELEHDKIKTYGAGKDRDKNHWRFIVDELLAQDVIQQDGGRYPVLKITEKGKAILFGREKVSGLKREESRRKSRAGKGTGFEKYNEALFEKLRSLRKKLADEQGVPPYVVFSDKTLHEMCRFYPSSLPDMAGITGVGAAKLERYGDDFIKEIKSYLGENPGIAVVRGQADNTSVGRARDKIKGETLDKTYELVTRGLSIEEIASVRNLSASTITGHIEQMLMDGREIDIDPLVDPSKRDEIAKLFNALRSWQLKPVIEHFNGAVSYDEAKLVRAFMRRPG
jgi:ATP-dependent DNA helicase RecQ